jgi:hypothetical protein
MIANIDVHASVVEDRILTERDGQLIIHLEFWRATLSPDLVGEETCEPNCLTCRCRHRDYSDSHNDSTTTFLFDACQVMEFPLRKKIMLLVLL